MLTLSNLITLTRAPLALLFLQTNMVWRIVAVVLAIISDGLDGYLARRYRAESAFGAFLDPLMDKLFALIAFSVFVSEGRLALWEMFALMARDGGILVFIAYMSLFGNWALYETVALRWSKLATAGQFVVMILLLVGFILPSWVYAVFVVLGLLSMFDLIRYHRKKQQQSKI